MASEEETKLAHAVPLKKGDYSVHILLEEGRGFVPISEGYILHRGTVDPLVAIKVFGGVKCGSPKKEIGPLSTVKWNDHFFFEMKNCTVEDIESATIAIELRDHRMLLADSLIGSYLMDMTYVYFQDKHALVHKWIALANPESSDYSAVKGYLKLGISVLGEGDSQVDLAVSEVGELKDVDMLLPPQIQPKACQLVIRAIKAEQLPKMDVGGTIDAYIECEFAGNKLKSKIIEADKANFSVQWYQDLLIPAIVPTVSGKVKIRVWDYDKGTKDELVGTTFIDFKELEREMKPEAPKHYSNYFWANIYGAPMSGTSGNFADKMNVDPRLASYWRGRILISVKIVETDKPKLMVIPVTEPGLPALISDVYDGGDEYETRCQVFSGSGLPCIGKQLKVAVRWGSKLNASTLQPNTNGACEWYETLTRKTIPSPSSNFDDLPDVFVYLMYDDVIISYIRLLPKDYQSISCQPEWLQLIPDKSTGVIKNDWEGGFLRLRFYCGKLNPAVDTSSQAGWKEKLKKPTPGNKLLLANIFQCRNLPSADSNGKADPYVLLQCGANSVHTGKEDRMNNLNPIWYETLAVPVSCFNKADAPPVVVQVWDFDTIGSDDLMGMYVAKMSEADEDQTAFQTPQWRKLSMGLSSGLGEILISFNLVNASPKPAAFNLVPDCEEVTVEINVLGLRDLKPALGWVPVNKSYIIFDLSSLQMPGEGKSIRNVQTQPGEPGPNPNLNAIIKFECMIPKDPMFSPALSCSVYDCLFMGMSQPLLGSFSIHLGELYHKRSGKSASSMLASALTLAKRSVAQESEVTDSTAISIFAPAAAPDVYMEKSQKLPSHVAASGVRRGEKQEMREEPSLTEARFGAFVKSPIYERNPKTGRMEELNPPDENYYMQIGYDRVPGEGTMHYRYVLKTELEKSKYADISPFDHFTIIRGQQVGVDSYFDLNSTETKVETAGTFKGLIRIVKTDEVEERRIRAQTIRTQTTAIVSKIETAGDVKEAWKRYAKEMEELSEAEADSEFDEIAKKLLHQTRVICRIYILDAFGLAQKDTNSQSDPYVRIKLGSKVWYDEQEHYQEDQPDPKIFKMYEVEATLPGISLLKVQFWDKDDILSNDKIGQTIIDLEDRFFSTKWRNLKEKPIETRPLFIKTTKVPQGGVRLWLEIVPVSERAELISRDISPRPPAEYEARLIVWGTEGVANYDDEGTSDIYIRAWINDCKPKETDTHYRCMNGKGSFNYRMKFPLVLNEAPGNTATIQIWDRDLLSKSDFIADVSFSFDKTARLAWETGGRMKRTEDSFIGGVKDKFWVDCMRRGAEGKMSHGGRVEVSLELVPLIQAQSCPVGEGRNEPNQDPFLPPPVGRFAWTWNPCKLIAQTVGPEYQCKAVLYCCLALCLILCVFTLPMTMSNVLTSAAFGMV